jgi:MerR family transcriptional regulator, light-induced transcriptional regulator
MPTIASLPAASRHLIKAVCEQTGVLPVTLRAWERRYELVKPGRTAANYRLYSDRDIALLRWVRSRMEAGNSISSVAREFHALRRAGHWPPLTGSLPAQTTAPNTTPSDEYARRLFSVLTAVDEPQAGALLGEAHGALNLETVCLEIIQPCLYEIGEAWYRGEIRIATEHFASNYLRGHLMGLFQACPMRQSAPRIVAGCAPDELHDIGSLVLALLLRREGYRVEYLGANVPLEDLAEYARAVRPALICLSAHSEETARGLRQLDARLAGMRPRPRFAFGGRVFNAQPALRAIVPGQFLGADARQAVAAVLAFLPL